jgi:hypothetical protein
MSETQPLAPEEIALRIFMLRGQRVLLDVDLAQIYGVTTKRLNEQVKRNARRFPADFVFQLTREEMQSLTRSTIDASDNAIVANHRSQIATAYQKHRNVRALPYAFTEHGAIQGANVLIAEVTIGSGVHTSKVSALPHSAQVTLHLRIVERAAHLSLFEQKFEIAALHFRQLHRLSNWKCPARIEGNSQIDTKLLTEVLLIGIQRRNDGIRNVERHQHGGRLSGIGPAARFQRGRALAGRVSLPSQITNLRCDEVAHSHPAPT